MSIILTVILYDKEGLANKIEQLERVLGLPINSGFGLGRYDATWKFDNVEEALKAEKVAQKIIGGPEYGETAVMEPDVEIY
jgi:hypothetical protein